MSSGNNSKTIGREPSCDLALEYPEISRFHASIELLDDGRVCLHDTGSHNGTFLNRNETWIRIRKVTLCIGDRIRFGGQDVSLERLTAIFGKRSNIRLEAKHFPPRQGNRAAGAFADISDAGPLLQKPKRNPVTGKIEEDRSN